jgi:hypothetical protein
VLLAACSSGGSDSGDEGDPAWNAVPITGYPYPVQMFDNEVPGGVNRHFAAGEFQGYGSVQYKTDPPTSGRHVGEISQPGVQDAGVPNEVLVHMMEHGASVVWLNCNASPALTSEGCLQVHDELAQVVNEEYGSGKFVIMVPEDTMAHHIALTGWQFMDAFDEFDAERVRTFIETFTCRFDPENTCN